MTCLVLSRCHAECWKADFEKFSVAHPMKKSQGEDWIGEILEAQDRTACGPVAPPDGLFLERVEYAA